ncbi:MAG: glycosyltransferase family 4 protein [Thermoplasmatales archaeon]
MKICIVVRILWSAGTQKFAIQQAKALQDAGHEVTVIFLRSTESGKVYDKLLKNVRYEIISEKNTSKFVHIYDLITGIFMSNRIGEGRVDYNLIRRFPRYIEKRNFDHIICQDQWAGLGGYYAKKKLGIKYSVLIHEQVNNFPWVKGFKRLFALLALRWQKNILYNADRIFTLTEPVAETLRRFYRGKVKVTSVFPGLDNHIERNYPDKKNQIMLVSYWNEVKIPESYIPVFKSIEGYNFIIAGNWISLAYRDSFIDKLRQENIIDKVIFVDHFSEDEKSALFRASKFYLRFGLNEKGPGYGTIEALEYGLPIICNNGLGISYYLSDKSFALVMDDLRNTEGVRAFIKYYDTKEKYERLQEEIGVIIDKLSWASHANKIIAEIMG